jgi:cytochrome c-type biogenesis protein CcmH/NrfF
MFRRWKALWALFGLGRGEPLLAREQQRQNTGVLRSAQNDDLLSQFSTCESSREARVHGYSMKRLMQGGLVCLLAVVMLGADPSSRFNKVGHEMICTCGCGQILLECNHVGCPVSPVMINELHAQMDGGESDTSILNWFAAKYGATVLAAPIRGGFDNVAWIAPMAVFLLATVGLGFLVRMWTARSGRRVPVSATGPDVGGDRLRERIRRETEY